MNDQILYDEEVDGLISNLLLTMGKENVKEDDVVQFITWATQARVANAMIDLALAGKVGVSWEDDEPKFSRSPELLKKFQDSQAAGLIVP